MHAEQCVIHADCCARCGTTLNLAAQQDKELPSCRARQDRCWRVLPCAHRANAGKLRAACLKSARKCQGTTVHTMLGSLLALPVGDLRVWNVASHCRAGCTSTAHLAPVPGAVAAATRLVACVAALELRVPRARAPSAERAELCQHAARHLSLTRLALAAQAPSHGGSQFRRPQ